jgi:hypothetical protein
MELTPVFSPTDCASAGAAINRNAAAMTVRFMNFSSYIRGKIMLNDVQSCWFLNPGARSPL